MNEFKSVVNDELMSGKIERTTLRLSDKLKLSPNIQQNTKIALKKSVTTVEVRKSKKRKDIDSIEQASVMLQNNNVYQDNENVNSLTVQEQISRMNALQNANIYEKKEGMGSDEFKKEEIIKIGATATSVSSDDIVIKKESGDNVEGIKKQINEEGYDKKCSLLLNTVEDRKEDNQDIVGNISDLLQTESIEEKKLKKYEKEEYEEKKGNPKKGISDNIYSKHVKLVIEEELEDNDKQVIQTNKSKKNRSIKLTKNKITRNVLIPRRITVQDLASSMSERVRDVQHMLSQMGYNVSATDFLDADQASMVVEAFNHTFRLINDGKLEEDLYSDDNGAELLPRAPIVTIMGHVDHGKTTLLDAIRESNIADIEFKGITQHIGAYQIVLDDNKRITFIDTPGHEAFTAMRACGTNVTDIVVLVVAADDGIMPQTIESINHVKAANVAMIVAVNKIDKHDANLDKITNSLLNYGIVAESLGGDVIVVPVSAKEKTNLDQLKSSILLIAELLELKAVYDTRASGVVIESKIDKNCGVVATLIIQKGTLKIGDIIVIDHHSYGRVRNMFDYNGKSEKIAIPSMPVKVLGLDNVPNSGSSFIVVDSEKQARELINYRQELFNAKLEVNAKENVHSNNSILSCDTIDKLHVILKCDVMGSVEAICYSISKITHEDIKLNILCKGVGNITKSDVLLAETSNAIILAFNVKADASVKELAKQKGVEIRYYSVIYDIIDDVKKILSNILKPLQQEVHVGTLSIRKVFSSGNAGNVLGCYVTNGLVRKGALIKLIRNSNVIYEGRIKVLRRFKDDVKEVNSGFECGILLDYSKEIYPENDIIHVLEVVEEVRMIK